MSCVGHFDTIEGFWWSYHNHPTSQLPEQQYLHIFKMGIQPMWEDPMNMHGGHFKITARTTESAASLWEVLALNMISEQLPTSRHVTGASIVAHYVGNYIVKLWLDTVDDEVVLSTYAFLLDTLNEEDYEKFNLVRHKMVINGSSKKTPQAHAKHCSATVQHNPRQMTPSAHEHWAPFVHDPYSLVGSTTQHPLGHVQ